MPIELSTSDTEALRRLQRSLADSFDHARVMRIQMLGKGSTPSFVADCSGIDASTVYRYKSAYLHSGENELLENRRKGYWGLLDNSQPSALREELTKHVYTDAKRVSQWIKSAPDIEYAVAGTVDLLNRLGLSYKKTAEVPREEQASGQEAFAKGLSGLFSSMPDDAAVYYADGVHPAHDGRSTYAYCHSKGLKEWAVGTRIKRLFLPPYSPNQNLIERLWKLLRKKVVNTGFYRTKEEFRNAIRHFFEHIGSFKEGSEILMISKFRLINSQAISVLTVTLIIA